MDYVSIISNLCYEIAALEKKLDELKRELDKESQEYRKSIQKEQQNVNPLN